MHLLGNLTFAEIGVIILILILLFGSRKIPQLARALGSSLSEFRRGKQEGENQNDKSPPRDTAKDQ